MSVSSTLSTSSVDASMADPTSSRWWGVGTRRPSLKNLLMGMRTSSWSSTSQPSSTSSSHQLTDPPYISPSSHPPPILPASSTSTPHPPPSLTSAPVTLVPTNTLPTPLTTDDANVGGGKTIDYLGSLALLINNVTGGGMVLFAQMYQRAGWLLPTLCLLLLMVVCGMGGLMLVECMAMMPHNGRLTRRVEYTSVMRHYCTRRWYLLISLFYQLSLTITNLSLIIQSIQVMDFAIVAIAGRTCAVPELSPNPGFHCPAFDGSLDLITPFAADVWCVPLGLFFTALIVIPLGLVNLDDNIRVQKAAFIALILIVLTWIGIMGQEGPTASYVPTVGSNLSTVLGVSMFNFAFVSSIPSWVCEKREDVSITKTLGTVLPLAVVIFVLMGWLGGTAFVPWTDSDTLLDKLRGTNVVGSISFYAFPIIVNLTSIPVLSIFQRYNLLKEKVCSRPMANFLAVILPWLIAIPLYNGAGYQNLANWGGVLITSVVNFLVPIVVYIVAVRRSNLELAETPARTPSDSAEEQITQQQRSSQEGPEPSTSVNATAPRTSQTVAEQVKEEGEKAQEVTAKAEKPRRKLSISGAVEWLKKAGSGKRPADADDGLGAGQQPSPLHHFSFSTTSTAKESDLSHPSYSPETPGQSSSASSTASALSASSFSTLPSTSAGGAEEEKLSHSPKLKSQALRWASEEDSKQRAAMVALAPFPRDSIQPATGSLRLARPASSSSHSSSLSSSRQNLLANLTSSFTSRSPRPDADKEVEMTPSSSAERPKEERKMPEAEQVTELVDDTFDVDEIQVEEVGVEEEEEEEEEKKAGGGAGGGSHSSMPGSSRAGSTRSLPVIDEGRGRENSRSLEDAVGEVGEERMEDTEATVAMPAVEEDSGERWRVVKDEWLPYRVRAAVVTLVVMSILCVLALEEQIRQSINSPGWGAG